MTGQAWSYHPTKKHAVLSAGAVSLSYDANGNATTRNGGAVSWTSYNYPSSISAASESATFAYGPGRDRWRMTYVNGGATETTYYIGRLLEKVIAGGASDFRHYIFAGNRPVAVYSRKSSGTNGITYLLLDHQGSIETLASSTGTTVANESFTAFGNRRNAATWTGAPSDRATLDGITRQGYTFQTVLGSIGLNHMNGRVQDSVIGRFMSPDPHTTDWSSPQSYNRYSYVLSNPLSFVDPSGFDYAVPSENGQRGCFDIYADNSGHQPSNDEVVLNGGRYLGTVCVSGNEDGLEHWRKKHRLGEGGPPGKPQKQCLKPDGSVGNDNAGSMSHPNVVFAGLDLEGYILFGGGIQLGRFLDRTTGNSGWYFSLDLGGGIGATAGGVAGAARNLSSFQGPTSVVGGGVGPVSASYISQPGSPASPVGGTVGGGVNAIPPLPVPAQIHASKSYTILFATSLPPC